MKLKIFFTIIGICIFIHGYTQENFKGTVVQQRYIRLNYKSPIKLQHSVSMSIKRLELGRYQMPYHNDVKRFIQNLDVKSARTVFDGTLFFWTINEFDWTESFFPGSCWYMYEFTGDKKWKDVASKFQNLFIDNRWLKTSHDLGFMFYCSFGNGYRLTKNSEYLQVLIDAGNSLISLFDSRIGCIKSWDSYSGADGHQVWQYPVIIDNIMIFC